MLLGTKIKYLLDEKEENYIDLRTKLKKEEESLLSKKIKSSIFGQFKKAKDIDLHPTITTITENFFTEYHKHFKEYGEVNCLVFNEELKFKTVSDILVNAKNSWDTCSIQIKIDDHEVETNIHLRAVNMCFDPYDPFIDFLSDCHHYCMEFNKSNLKWKCTRIKTISTEDFIKKLEDAKK